MTTKKVRIPRDSEEFVITTGRRDRSGIQRNGPAIQCKDWLVIPIVDMEGNLLNVRITRLHVKTAEEGP